MYAIMSRLLVAVACLGLLQPGLAYRQGVTHDGSWEPEYVLVATSQNITVNCHSRKSVVFNGTSPGPAIHMVEGHTTWVRVYNQIENDNLTVVGRISFMPKSMFEEMKRADAK